MKKQSKIIAISVIILLLLGGYFLYRFAEQEKQSKNLNLILISIDTLRPDHMGLYGYKKNTTPNIDAWAKSATVFTNAYTVFPMTYPSFVALFTGKYPTSLGVYDHNDVFNALDTNRVDNLVSDSLITLPMIFRKNDYSTAAFVTNPILSRNYSVMGRGFETYQVLSEKDYKKNNDSTIQWLKQNKNKKFFLWVHLMNPHIPYSPPSQYRCSFNKTFCSDIQNQGMESLISEQYKLVNDEMNTCFLSPLKESVIEKYKTLYDGEIAHTDTLVQELLQEIKSLDLESKSVIVLNSDHGEGFDHNHNFEHPENLFESGVRIPFIIKHPFAGGSKKVSNMITNIDFMPTILDLLKIKNATTTDGVSFSNLITNWNDSSFEKKTKERGIFLTGFGMNRFGLIKGNYKYLSQKNTCDPSVPSELFFNIKMDPLEVKNSIQMSIAASYKTQLENDIIRYNAKPNTTPTPLKSVESKNQETLDRIKSLGY